MQARDSIFGGAGGGGGGGRSDVQLGAQPLDPNTTESIA